MTTSLDHGHSYCTAACDGEKGDSETHRFEENNQATDRPYFDQAKCYAPSDHEPTIAHARAGCHCGRIRISHPERLIYADLGISKIQLARYYDKIADWIVPHVSGRPLTLVHCPAGLAAPCLYLKHAKAWGPKRSAE